MFMMNQLNGFDAGFFPFYDSGDRTGSITASTTQTVGGGSAPNLVNGSQTADASNAIWFNSSAVSAKEIKFQFSAPARVVEVTWRKNNGDAGGDGTHKWQGSNDGSAWTDLTANFVLMNASVTSETHDLSANANSYLYYRLLGVSGNTGTQWHTEVNFKY